MRFARTANSECDQCRNGSDLAQLWQHKFTRTIIQIFRRRNKGNENDDPESESKADQEIESNWQPTENFQRRTTETVKVEHKI